MFIDAHYDPTDLMEADNFKKGELKVFLGLFNENFFQCYLAILSILFSFHKKCKFSFFFFFGILKPMWWVGGVLCLRKTVPMEIAEMAKLWEFASNAPKFELKDIEAALDEIQVDFFYLCSSSIVSFTFRP